MKSEDSAAVMKTIEMLILSTDLAKHFNIIKEFKGILEKAKTDFKSVADSLRNGLLQVVIKSADVSNQTRAYDTATKWNFAVYVLLLFTFRFVILTACVSAFGKSFRVFPERVAGEGTNQKRIKTVF